MLLPGLTAYLDHYNDAATYRPMLPGGQAGKIPSVDPPSRLPGAIADIATLALGGVDAALSGAAMRAAEAIAPLEPFLAGAGAAPGTASRLASVPNKLRLFPNEPLRSFSDDYPNGALVDASGRLVQDIEGRPLAAPLVFGRNTSGGVDQGG